ncbi:MAG: hypothetical protein C4530_11060 [Desulfobacteraceae bacterium]|nr:MAG: hypothetical protein C4530_11060 [Desulfobacteraceae bacterium]
MDRLETAKRLIIAALMFSVFILLSILADSAIRSGHMGMKGLNLPGPAFFPSGHPARHPEGIHAAVDLRFSPGIPLRLNGPIYPVEGPAEMRRGIDPP